MPTKIYMVYRDMGHDGIWMDTMKFFLSKENAEAYVPILQQDIVGHWGHTVKCEEYPIDDAEETDNAN